MLCSLFYFSFQNHCKIGLIRFFPSLFKHALLFLCFSICRTFCVFSWVFSAGMKLRLNPFLSLSLPLCFFLNVIGFSSSFYGFISLPFSFYNPILFPTTASNVENFRISQRTAMWKCSFFRVCLLSVSTMCIIHTFTHIDVGMCRWMRHKI